MKRLLESPMNSSSRMTGLEQEEEIKHTTVGYGILNSFANTMDFAEYALTHHEQWDGSGYPRRSTLRVTIKWPIIIHKCMVMPLEKS